VADVEGFAYTDARQTIEHCLRRIGGRGKDLEDLEFSACEIDAIGKRAPGVNRYSQVVSLIGQRILV
jgi:hypothetical protein